MSLSRFPSSTSLASILALGLGLGAGCGGGDSCGPAGASDTGVIASGGGLTLTYGQFTGMQNNDCPASGAPKGLVSLTITGMQTDAGGAGFANLCVGRPDLLASQPLGLGFDAAAAVHVVDLTATTGGCTVKIDRSQPPSGTASASGLCDNGGNAAGFALVLDATLTLTRTCGSTVDAVPITLRGRVAVAGP
ncbi:MAG TPA: hypothetical protein VF516_34345 [Kofleriaceae bacterium]